MHESLCGLMFIFGAGAVTAPVMATDDPAAPPPGALPSMTLPAEPEPMSLWLDEVRAQREVWDQRRRAAKGAMDARRRWVDPRGAAKQEVWEEQTRRRREAFREQVEREREAFLSHTPWGEPQPPWQDAPPTPAAPQGISPPVQDGLDDADRGTVPTAPYPPLPGWDNRWYYKGY